jgi:hypothetical protein
MYRKDQFHFENARGMSTKVLVTQNGWVGIILIVLFQKARSLASHSIFTVLDLKHYSYRTYN